MIENIFSSLISSLVLTFVIIPSLIRIASIKNLYDDPNSRSSHSGSIPTLGGIAFYVSILFSLTFWGDFSIDPIIQYVLAAMTIVTFIGLKDDLLGLEPFHKLMGQLFAAMVLVIWGGIRITSLYGILGIGELPYIISVIFSIFTILVIINSFNLIDGINGLSASVGIVSALSFGIWFYLVNDSSQLTLLAFTLVGSLIAFLRFNLTPAKIFMGDTGSLLIGVIISVLAIRFIELNANTQSIYAFKSAPALAMGVIAYPLFDLLRSFSIRLLKGHSPFKPDRNHIHHLLLDNGFSHSLSTSLIVLFNIVLIFVIFIFNKLSIYALGAIIVGSLLFFAGLLSYFKRKKLGRKSE